ncbi:MAG: hydrogenase subunit MbhD domain-containing protein [Candidatus Marinimicrobia bacterium]|nr:hydrogenase subunit MbhD domain-containing protein [Candidatus Neomarinimicrobiota bacterium]
MTTIIIIVLGVIMIAAAILAVHQKNLLSAIIVAGAISLLASILYIILAAPDVAMTEAAIGSGLTTIVFLFALNKIRKQDKHG